MLTAIGRTVNEMTSPHGADAYLDKPFDIREVIDVVAGLLPIEDSRFDRVPILIFQSPSLVLPSSQRESRVDSPSES